MSRARVLKLVAGFIVFLAVETASAANTWRCEDGTGHRYQSTQNVPSDKCVRMNEDEALVDLAINKVAELPKVAGRADPQWGVEAFCKTQKARTCQASDSSEQFGALNGVWFSLFRDSAAVASSPDTKVEQWTNTGHWDLSCSRDKMTSARSCLVKQGDLYVFVKADGKVLVSVGDEHFPGSQTSIKIGAKRFDTTERDGFFTTGNQIVSLMRNGTPVVTRYMKWPYRSWIDTEFTAYGLDTAVHVARWIIKKGEL